ncbi:MAG: LptE family protein [Flavobacteriales bacterium]|nr:LptE family protein [Flavobacteriales bacterium]
MKYFFFAIAMVSVLSCGIYSPYGAQTSGAKTFSVEYFKPQTPLASPELAQNFTEFLRDVILRQSTLSLEERDGELQFSGLITGYDVSPVSVQGIDAGETAATNRLTITVKVKYVNTLNEELNFDRSFTKFSDYDAGEDLFSIEAELMEDINDQLTQEIFNASLGNW